MVWSSSITPPLRSLQPVASFCASRALTPLHRTARLSVSFVHSTTRCAPCSSTHPCRPPTGRRPSPPPATCSTGAPPPFATRYPTRSCMARPLSMSIFGSLGLYTTQTFRPLVPTSLLHARRLVSSLGILPLTKGTAALIFSRKIIVSHHVVFDESRFPFAASPTDRSALDFMLHNTVDTLLCSTNPAAPPRCSATAAAPPSVDTEQPLLYRLRADLDGRGPQPLSSSAPSSTHWSGRAWFCAPAWSLFGTCTPGGYSVQPPARVH